MAEVITEQIIAVLVFTNTTRRNQARTLITQYLSRQAAGTRDYTLLDVAAGKYGGGPTLVVNCPFVLRVDADAAWADLDAQNPSFLLVGSVAEQFTSTEDPEAGVNDTVYVHRKHWPAQPEDF